MNNHHTDAHTADTSKKTLSDRGASMVEYALLLALIAMIAVGAVGAFGGGLSGEFSDIGSTVESNLDSR